MHAHSADCLVVSHWLPTEEWDRQGDERSGMDSLRDRYEMGLFWHTVTTLMPTGEGKK